MDYTKFNKCFKAEEYNTDNQNGDFPEIPCGDYPVEVMDIDLKESKAGNLMLSIDFRITDGDYAKQHIFYNQVISKSMFGFKIAIAMAQDLLPGSQFDIDNNDPYGSFDAYITNIGSNIGGMIYQLNKDKKQSKKTNATFDTYEIVDVIKSNYDANNSTDFSY